MASLLFLLLGLAGVRDLGPVPSVAMFATFFLCAFPIVIIFNGFEGFSSNQLMKKVWEECPERWSRVDRVLIAIGSLSFFASFLLVLTGILPEEPADGFSR